MDNAVAKTSHVTSNFSNNNCVDLCVIGGIPSEEEPTNPFVHPVELRGEAGGMVKIEGLFDDGAMVNSISEKIFALVKDALGELAASEKALRMADGTIVPSRGRWSGEVTLGNRQWVVRSLPKRRWMVVAVRETPPTNVQSHPQLRR